MSVFLPLLTLLGGMFLQQPPSRETPPALEQLLSTQELRELSRKDKFHDRADVFDHALERLVRELGRTVKGEELEPILESLRRIRGLVHYVEIEIKPSVRRKEFRSRQVKKLEIHLRKLVEALRDYRISVPFEYRSQFDQTSDRIEELRDSLLKRIFGISNRHSRLWSHTSPALLLPLDSTHLRPVSLRQRRDLPGTPHGDQFTEDELDKIRFNQELKKRVEIFLKIAESRMKEIDKRLQPGYKGDSKEEDNPLQFYTLADMVHAYERAIDAIMTNIDEKYKYKQASEKDIHKSLKKLNKKINEFIPKLDPIKQHAVKIRDEVLYRETLKAMKTSDIAKKGSELGLGGAVKH